jgi:hypothetical protein
VSDCKVEERQVSVLGRTEDEDAGVETVGPSAVRGGGKLLAIEKLITVLNDLRQEKSNQKKTLKTIFSTSPVLLPRQQGNVISELHWITIYVLSKDYSYGDRNKNVGELRGDIGAIKYVFTLSFRKPQSSLPKKRTVQPGDVFEDIAFKPGFEIVKFYTRL